jgi:hypothetical protein
MRNFTSLAISAVLAAALLTAPAARAADVLTGLNTATATSILQEWGATEITEHPSVISKVNEQVTMKLRYFTFKRANLTYVATLACNTADPTGNCVGLRVSCSFEGAAPLATLNSYNSRFPAGKAYQETKVYTSERYMIFDNGVTRENVLAQLNVFASLTSLMLQHIKSGATIASAPATPGGGQAASTAPMAADAALMHIAASEAAMPQAVNKTK